VAALANEIGYYPMLFSLLQVLDGEPGNFRPTQTASEEDSYHGVITHAAQIGGIEYGEESFSLLSSQPVSNAHAMLLHSFYCKYRKFKIRP
jgi:hypothetical protein